MHGRERDEKREEDGGSNGSQYLLSLAASTGVEGVLGIGGAYHLLRVHRWVEGCDGPNEVVWSHETLPINLHRGKVPGTVVQGKRRGGQSVRS